MCYLICLFLCASLAVSHLFLFLSLCICPNVWFEDHLLSDTLVGHDSDSPDSLCAQNNNFHSCTAVSADPSLINPAVGLLEPPPPTTSSKSRLSLERSFSAEEDQQKCVECALQPARVYTITGESGMLGTSRGSKENLELEVLKGGREACHAQPSTSSNSSSPTQRHHHHGSGSGSGNHHHGNHHHGNHHHGNISGGGNGGTSGTSPHQHISSAGTSHHQHGAHHHHLSQPLQSSVSAHNIRGWGEGKECGLACESCPGAPSRSQGSLDLESSTREAGKQRRPPLERMCSVDRMTGLERGERGRAARERKRERLWPRGRGGVQSTTGGVDVFDVPWSVFFPLSCVSLLSPVCLFCALSLCGVDYVCVVAGESADCGPKKYLNTKLHLNECLNAEFYKYSGPKTELARGIQGHATHILRHLKANNSFKTMSVGNSKNYLSTPCFSSVITFTLCLSFYLSLLILPYLD